MLRHLPKWVEYGAFALSLLAGCVNAVGLLGFQHQSISHLSGSVTLLGAELFNQPSVALHLAVVVLSFLLGSAISGGVLTGSSLKLGRHYDSLLIIEGALFIAAIFLLNNHETYGHYVASAACGMQNALATRYSGAIIRTTHVTGVLTDLGLMLGGAFRGETFDKRKAVLLLLIVSGFTVGGVLGAFLYQRYMFYALVFPALSCFGLAFVYRHYLSAKSRKAD